MVIKYTLFIIFLVILLVGYLFYSEYRDNIVFRGEKFTESYGVRKLLDFIIPRDTKVTDNRLFYVFGSTTVRDFYVIKLISLVCAIVVSFCVVYTNYFNNRVEAFEAPKDLAYPIEEHDYNILVKDLSFFTMDKQTDLENLNRNIKYSDEYLRYSQTSIEVLYDALYDINYKLNNAFGLIEIIVAIMIILGGWCLPDFILWLLFKMLKMDMSYEYAKLESYIYLNCDSRVETILTGLTQESLVYRELFKAFLLRYREDRVESYKLILGEPTFTQEFKTLVEYLNLLENGNPASVKNKISVNRTNYLNKLRFEIRRSAKIKRDILFGICVGTVVVSLGGVLVAIITNAF